jgi:deoxyguanosine kinase
VAYSFITVEGNIGAGKTTLSQLLAQALDAALVLEQFAENPFLPKFYTSPDKYAFPLELSFLADRFKQLKDIQNTQTLFNSCTVSDYLFIKCKLFAKVNLPEDEYRLFESLFDIIYNNIATPDLLIYLHCPVPKLQQNIKNRARSYEQDIPNNYLQELQDAYWNYIKTISIPTLVINTEEVDFLNNSYDFNILLSLIKQTWKPGLNYISFEQLKKASL